MFTPVVVSTPENPLVGVTREIKQFRTVDLQLHNDEMLRERLWLEFCGKVALALQRLARCRPSPEGSPLGGQAGPSLDPVVRCVLPPGAPQPILLLRFWQEPAQLNLGMLNQFLELGAARIGVKL